VTIIEAAQNADGGWPYYKGRKSWTEPTAFALLSELAIGAEERECFRHGILWLRANQNHDGGWGPQPGVGPSTWVTALVGLLPEPLIGQHARQTGTHWLLEQTGQESTVVFRVRQWMMGNHDVDGGADRGWPWFPGAAAWVMPTAISVLALMKEQRIRPSVPTQARIAAGQHYLLSHACKEGGWNHGSTRVLGYEAKPYPETTGVALMALKNVKSQVVAQGISVAERFLSDPKCPGASWLRLALSAHGRPVAAEPMAASVSGTHRAVNTVEVAVRILSENPHELLS
jgi:hypothetical protein